MGREANTVGHSRRLGGVSGDVRKVADISWIHLTQYSQSWTYGIISYIKHLFTSPFSTTSTALMQV